MRKNERDIKNITEFPRHLHPPSLLVLRLVLFYGSKISQSQVTLHSAPHRQQLLSTEKQPLNAISVLLFWPYCSLKKAAFYNFCAFKIFSDENISFKKRNSFCGHILKVLFVITLGRIWLRFSVRSDSENSHLKASKQDSQN